MPTSRFFVVALLWYTAAFIVAAAGAYFADSHRFVTNAWHVYFIAHSTGTLTSDSDVMWSEVYRLIMATVAALACLVCLVHRFNPKSPRTALTTAPSTWERRSIVVYAALLFPIALLVLPANLHTQILIDIGALPQRTSLLSTSFPKAAVAIGDTLLARFPGGAIVVPTDPAFAALAKSFRRRSAGTQIESISLWRDPNTRNIIILSAATTDPSDGNDVLTVRYAATPRINSARYDPIAAAITPLLGGEPRDSYFAEIWRPYLIPYSLYSVTLYLLIIFPVLFFLIRSTREDIRRFRDSSRLSTQVPGSATEATLQDLQKASEHRLDAINDVIPRYLAVSLVVCAVATVEFGFGFIRSSSTLEATTFGQVALIAIWLTSLIVAAILFTFYYDEYGYAFAGFEAMEDASSGELYDKVHEKKINFRKEYRSQQLLARGGVAFLILGALLALIKTLGTAVLVPAVCGNLPAVANQIVHALYASRLSKVRTCEDYTNSLRPGTSFNYRHDGLDSVSYLISGPEQLERPGVDRTPDGDRH